MDEKLIEQVRERSFLYDKSHKDYKNNNKRDNAWENIGKELNITGDTAKKRWRTIKDRYLRLKQQENLASGSGSRGGKIPNYKFGGLLSFLDECSNVNKKTNCDYDPLSADDIIEKTYTDDIFEEQGDAQWSSADEVVLKSTIIELLKIIKTLKYDKKSSSIEAAFCNSLRVQLEEAQLPATSFLRFQMKVLQALSEEIAKAKHDMPSTSQEF